MLWLSNPTHNCDCKNLQHYRVPVMLNFTAFKLALALAACSFFLAGTSVAQGIPSAAEMIEQLKAPSAPPTVTPGPRTRSLRNLIIESAPPPVAAAEQPAPVSAAPAPRPSLSLLIQFDFNSAHVKPESQQALGNLAQALKSPELNQSRFAVEGHTDSRGRADYNLKLSQQRADAVRTVLAHNGVVESRLSAVGKGSTEPANAADPQAAENRRVRIVNLN